MRGGDYQAYAKCSESEYVFILTKQLISSISKDFRRMGRTNFPFPHYLSLFCVLHINITT